MFRFPISGALALVLALGFVADSRAGIVTPAGLNPGDQFRIVFVTTTTTVASTNNLPYYDTIVLGDALAGGLGTYYVSPVTWEAIGSTASVNAITRLPADGVPIFLPDGTEVASSGAALWGGSTVQLLHAIDETATGATVGLINVWTGTRPNGTEAVNAGGLGDPSVAIGGTTNLNSGWVFAGSQLNSFVINGFSGVLYGFSDVLTVPGQVSSAVPEPGTFTIMLVGLGGFVGSHLLARRRREAPSRPAIAS